MAETSLVKVSIVPRGDYNPSAEYERLDLVTYNRNGYQAKTNVTGVAPGTDATKWMLQVMGATVIPDAPDSNGTYSLKVVVADGSATYSWVADT